MSIFSFVNHERYPEDQYVSESCTLCFEGKYRVTYVRKKTQTGGEFWSEISASVKHNGDKKFLRSFSQDSNFLQDDIKAFLEGRSWEVRAQAPRTSGGYVTQKSQSDDEIPF